MKKGLTFVALSALSISSVIVASAPQASAATVAIGFYNIVDESYTSLQTFKTLSKVEKQNLFKDKNVYFVSPSGVIGAMDVLISSNAQISSKLVAVDKFQQDNGVDFNNMSTPAVPAIELEVTDIY